ncbi:hypothetical protein C1924_08975 [Stenotrophomonas sp. ESTM1D_MKCIP4_1]|uniref:hypothetical protein n=1 Tax=Stenotrophomonas sp. ESTM1D_MKCIP4_1 TaxID=2072414 RepID=UPI000D5411FD|nr:hypothetical protein [Stenotrophomonas sp. ESTM1D_MKCIP4_1]AWH53298.1 hypothetical protein C1924_08975 [Stenotrophomonas sp. ESTM1D_MKCIP4_1]
MNVQPLLLALTLASPVVTPLHAQEARTPPAPACLDARDVQQVEQDTPGSIAVADGQGRAFRIDFAAACPGVNEADTLRLEAPQGWACGQPGERVVVDDRTCVVRAVTPIDNRSFATIARESSRQYAATLPGVTVSAKGRGRRSGDTPHTFQTSSAVCFATRNVRGWSETPGGVVVETNPRRNGGHRYYQVELASSCSILAGASEVDFQSGLQNGLICGNPRDRIVMMPSGIEGDGRSYTPSFARPGCDILAVYPKDDSRAP